MLIVRARAVSYGSDIGSYGSDVVVRTGDVSYGSDIGSYGSDVGS
jgi:hypothetical protein